MDQQVLAAWVSAAAAAIQAIGAIAAIVVAIRLARDSEHRAIEADRASVERELAAEQKAVERADAADRAAEQRVARALEQSRSNMIATIVALSREVLEETNTALIAAEGQFGGSAFGGTVSGGFEAKQAKNVKELIPQWKINAHDVDLVKAISRLERAIKPWQTPNGGVTGSAYVSMFRANRDEIRAAMGEIEELDLQIERQKPGHSRTG